MKVIIACKIGSAELYLNEGDKIHECYSCLKLIIQVHLHVGIQKHVRYLRWSVLQK